MYRGWDGYIIHARIPIAYDIFRPGGSIVFELGFCDGRLTRGEGDYDGVAFRNAGGGCAGVGGGE